MSDERLRLGNDAAESSGVLTYLTNAVESKQPIEAQRAIWTCKALGAHLHIAPCLTYNTAGQHGEPMAG